MVRIVYTMDFGAGETIEVVTGPYLGVRVEANELYGSRGESGVATRVEPVFHMLAYLSFKHKAWVLCGTGEKEPKCHAHSFRIEEVYL